MGAKLGENSLCGAEEAWGAHNPQVVGSKPTKAIYLFVLLPSLASLNQSVRCHNHATPWLRFCFVLNCLSGDTSDYFLFYVVQRVFLFLRNLQRVYLPTQPPTNLCVATTMPRPRSAFAVELSVCLAPSKQAITVLTLFLLLLLSERQ